MHVGGIQFLLADGSVRMMSQNLPETLIKALSTRDGGEVIDNVTLP